MKVNILYPHKLDSPDGSGFEVEPVAVLKNGAAKVFLIKNHRIGGELELFGVTELEGGYLGWYPVFSLNQAILKSMINANIDKVYRIQHEFDEELRQWKMVDFSIGDLEAEIEWLKGYMINFHILRKENEFILGKVTFRK
jgi:hypothetical protein